MQYPLSKMLNLSSLRRNEEFVMMPHISTYLVTLNLRIICFIFEILCFNRELIKAIVMQYFESAFADGNPLDEPIPLLL